MVLILRIRILYKSFKDYKCLIKINNMDHLLSPISPFLGYCMKAFCSVSSSSSFSTGIGLGYDNLQYW